MKGATLTELRLISPEDKKELALRLSRIEGQIHAIRQMIEREESCELVAQQLAAAREALCKAFAELVVRAIKRHCVAGQKLDLPAQQKLVALTKILTKYT